MEEGSRKASQVPDCGKSREQDLYQREVKAEECVRKEKQRALFAAKQRRAIDVTYDDASTLTTALSPTSIATEPAFFVDKIPQKK